jgi:hypothetical protein
MVTDKQNDVDYPNRGENLLFSLAAIRLEFGLAIAPFNFDENFNGMRLIYGSNKRC